ncbi:uncharacterized protein LOC129894822 [Solanum dulcamara]|uniref:uncharacterized protein LOC129894822 n=1 Tax=Solanum dulcamara TaxID=45834 RepID=UPI0024850C80|nr:uncharacterized protein LOC129894822 [Solanum dulcamara]
MAPYEALYGKKYRLSIGWFDVGEIKFIGPDLIQQAIDKVKLIQERLLAAQSRQKAYADNQRRPLEFQVDDWVFLKVSPMKGVMRFDKKGKLSSRYIGPYQIVRKVRKVAYELDLPADLEAVHPVFHVSMLRKFIGDPSRVFPIQDIQVTEELSYEEQSMAISDRQVRRLCTKDVASVKVLWRNNHREEMTWEAEEEMKKKYPQLFSAPTGRRPQNRILTVSSALKWLNLASSIVGMSIDAIGSSLEPFDALVFEIWRKIDFGQYS